MDNLALDMSGGVDPSTGILRTGKENQVYVRFYKGTKRDNFQSQQSGVPIEKAVDYVEIRQFGEKDSTVREVTELDRRRWPQAWMAYSQDMEQVQDGTPLDVLFPKNPEIVATLKASHIWTVQALAGVPDSVTNIPFVSDHKKRAQVFLDSLKGGQQFHQLESELETQKLKNMELEDRLAAMEKALAAKAKPEKE